MRNRFIFVLIAFLFLFIPINLFALEGEVTINCGSSTLKAGEKTDCDVYYNVKKGKIIGFNANISGNGVTINSFRKTTKDGSTWLGDNWEKGKSSGSPLIGVNGIARNGNVQIGTINITLNSGVAGTATLTLSGIKVIDDDNVSNSYSDKIISISVLSDDITLKGLTVDGNDVFDSMSFSTKNSSVTINAIPNDVNTKVVSGNGKVTIPCGSSVISVVVESQSGKKGTHSIDAARLCNNNPYLRDLYAENYKIKPDFQYDKFEYSVTVESSQSTLEIEAIKAEEKSKVSGAGKVSIKYGLNTIPITVTAEDGKTKTVYKLTVYRPDNRDKDAELTELNVTNTDIVFDSEKRVFETYVNSDIDSVTITAKSSNSKAKITGTGEKKLSYGENRFEVVLKTEKGNSRKYVVYITRRDKDNRDTNNYLSSLEIKGYDIDFNSDIDSYTIVGRDDVKSLDIVATADSEKAKVEIISNSNLVPGENLIRVRVTAENGSVREYKIKYKISSDDNGIVGNNDNKDETSFVVIAVVFGAVVIGTVVFIIIQKKKGETSLFISDDNYVDVVEEVLKERQEQEDQKLEPEPKQEQEPEPEQEQESNEEQDQNDSNNV